jgi:hypothetical protein
MKANLHVLRLFQVWAAVREAFEETDGKAGDMLPPKIQAKVIPIDPPREPSPPPIATASGA